MAKEAKSRFGISPLVCDPEDTELATLDRVPKDKAVIFVMATYGDGEPTENAESMISFLEDENVEFSSGGNSLENLNYAIFGLGNKTYQQFNEMARRVDKRLTELGAKRIGERGEADELLTIEAGYLDWKDDMWKAFCQRLNITEGEGAGDAADFSVAEVASAPVSSVFQGELSSHALKTSIIGEAQPGQYGPKNPYTSPVTVARELFTTNADRNCIHMELDIAGTNISYQHGDHVAIWPSSPDMAVERFLSVLGLRDKRDVAVDVTALDPALAQVPFPTPATYTSIFRHYLEISALASRQALGTLAKYAPNPRAKAMLDRWGRDKDIYAKEIEGVRIRLAEALQLATGDDPRDPTKATVWPIPFDVILSILPRQKPRYYSISSSSKLHPNTIHVTAVVLKYLTPASQLHNDNPRWIYGLTTNFLLNVMDSYDQKAAGGSAQVPIRLEGMPTTVPSYRIGGPRDAHTIPSGYAVPIHTRRAPFRLPPRQTVPIIMIGPGTGVAPFRGFVQERIALARTARERKGPNAIDDWAPMWLFYGCRRADEDFLYRDEWPGYAKELGEDKFIMHTAFSRGPARKPDGSKIYVQDLIWEQRDKLAKAIAQGAYIYICGDGLNMSREVEHTFAKIMAEYRGGTVELEGVDEVKSLKERKRFLTDTWS